MESPQRKDEEEGGAVQRWKVAAGVTMDLGILDCPICCHPMFPPVFQCTVGHTICAFCHDKLSDKCHFCSLPTVYSRCHMVEDIIESTKVACSNVNHGRTTRITYYQKKEHEEGCEHAPCHCPVGGCSFSGPTTKLLDHLSDKHDQALTKIPYKKPFVIRLNVASAVLVGEDGHLFQVNMLLRSIGGVILVYCLQGHSTESKFKCRLTLSEPGYSQDTEFLVSSTNLLDGKPQDCIIPFVVPKLLLWGTGSSATAKIKVGMVLSMVLTPL